MVGTELLIPTHRMYGIRFGLYSSEEILQLSVKEITNPQSLDALLHPTYGGLYDPALGIFSLKISALQTYLYTSMRLCANQRSKMFKSCISKPSFEALTRNIAEISLQIRHKENEYCLYFSFEFASLLQCQ